MEKTSLYFFITYFRKQKENANDIDFVVPENNENKPECIYIDEQYENQLYYYNKIFKVSKSAGKGKKGNNYYFEFEINDEKFIISFDSKGSTFIYDVNLEVGKRILEIRRKINQNKEYYQTIEYFIKALEKNGEEKMIDELYKETIDIYAKKKGFTFMIILFLKIYQKKNLCPELLKIFKKINENPKDNEKNMDRKPILKDYTSKFKSIISEADTVIETNNYNLIEFYGIVLCYLNYYDYENFSSITNELYNKKPEDLYEILLIYNAHFKYPINQNLDFFNKFISYAVANKEFPVFEKGLNYIKDIETFLNILEKNKEAIFEKYNAQIIEKVIILDDLKFKKTDMKDESKNKIVIEETESSDNSTKTIKKCTEEINVSAGKKKNKSIFEVIDNIKSIIKFCKNKSTFLIYFTNNFWSYVLNYYNEPKIDNIYICFKLRETFISYHELVLKVFEKKDEKKFTIKKDAINYYERDEFAFILDQIIKKYNNNQEVKNIEKLAFITRYNPYYIETRYSNKVDCSIFDSFDLNKIDKEFIEDFKRMNFEIIFKENIAEYIKKFIEKINNIPNFNTVIQLINIKNIENKSLYLDLINKRYDYFISNGIGLLTEGKLKEAIHFVAKIAILNYAYEKKGKKFDFIKIRIKKLSKIIPLIYIEIINICFNKEDNDIDIDYTEMKNYIFYEFPNKSNNENDIGNILNLVDCLGGKNKKKETLNLQINLS
jgi:hypothetical protein